MTGDPTAGDPGSGDPGAGGRRLVLLRHAKSDWPDVADHDRPLAKRGRRDAPAVGRWLGRAGYGPDVVVCSTALRARETWELAAGGLLAAVPGAAPTVRYEPRVYDASVLGLLMLVREFSPEWRTALVVGHNPGLAELTAGLTDPPPDPPAAFPTAAVAVLALPGPWSEVGPGEARLLAFAIPADMNYLFSNIYRHAGIALITSAGLCSYVDTISVLFDPPGVLGGAVVDELQDGDPRQVGKYTLLGRLGAGGMGQVFLGRSIGGRQVAVKVIRSDLARDRNFRARFAREVEAASRVSGAFTAPVIDADPDAVTPWLVTSYVRGPSLADAVEQHGPLPLSSVLTLAAGLAEGLAAVHDAGVIHRDLKPSNVLLASDGPRLIDFGISQAADFAQVTLTGMVVGTPGFMSPEQAVGDPVGPASDIFSLGAVVAFAAAGEGPFGTGSPSARQHRVLFSPPRLDNLPAELRPIVARCMSRDPAQRPTASQFLAELVAAHPSAADQTDWLPTGILPGTGSTSARTPSNPSVPPAAPTPFAWESPAPAPSTPPASSTPAASPASPASPASSTPQASSTPPVSPVSPASPASPGWESPPWTPGWEATLTSSSQHPDEVTNPVTQPPDPRSRPTHQAPPGQGSPPPGQGPPPGWQGPPPGWQEPQPGWQGPPPAVPGPPQRKRRRPWVIAGVAVLVVVAAVIGALLALPKPIPPLLQTTGLVAGDQTPQSLQLAWAGPASGPLPDRYEILRDGHELASVPGTTTDYRVTGLDPATAYRFTVIAIRGAKHAAPSIALTVTTPTPPLSDAVLSSSGPANLTETAGNFTETYNSKFSKRDVGDTWQEPWSFVPGCASGPCAVQASGSVVGPQFTTQLTRNGATYSGSVAIDNWWYCGTNINNRMDTTLNIQVTGVHAKMIAGVWTVTSYTGTLVWNVHYDSNGNCPAATYKMKLAGT